MELIAMPRRLVSPIFFLTGLVALATDSAPIDAADWMFRRSYYSHDSAPGDLDDSPPGSRLAYRDPWVGAHPHVAVRSGYRSNSFTINNGSSTDTTIFRENWYDVNY